MAISEAQKKFIKLRAKGVNYREISEVLKVSELEIINWNKDLSMEISNAHALELEALQDEFYMLKERRIKLFGEKLKAISEELKTRDLSDIQTEKLYDLFFKMYRLLEKEAVETNYLSDKEIEDKKARAKSMTFKPLL